MGEIWWRNELFIVFVSINFLIIKFPGRLCRWIVSQKIFMGWSYTRTPAVIRYTHTHHAHTHTHTHYLELSLPSLSLCQHAELFVKYLVRFSFARFASTRWSRSMAHHSWLVFTSSKRASNNRIWIMDLQLVAPWCKSWLLVRTDNE